ncbi:MULTISPECIES: hypothetical protein [Nitrosomonas]|uniref:hypothetical protein n=1 Tax=Nitrosomonas TaxID=914 RepID=UPI000A7CD947|nr:MULTISPECIES: hypothetical protein [Nitrosomonas]UVS60776.1 hypothetical protein NX761_14935 [Nitrosomonas sp. PLL12]
MQKIPQRFSGGCNYGLTVEFEVIDRNVSDRSVAPRLIAKLPDAQAMVANKG